MKRNMKRICLFIMFATAWIHAVANAGDTFSIDVETEGTTVTLPFKVLSELARKVELAIHAVRPTSSRT